MLVIISFKGSKLLSENFSLFDIYPSLDEFIYVKINMMVFVDRIMTVQFKTREQYDQEDWERFRAKQREIHRRKAEKFEKDGFKFKHKDCGLSFKNFKEFETHYNHHQEELKKALICNQPECNGLQFKIKKKYFEHVEEHKATAKRKIINSIR